MPMRSAAAGGVQVSLQLSNVVAPCAPPVLCSRRAGCGYCRHLHSVPAVMPCTAAQAVIGTCSCKKDRTFGELLDSYIASHPDMMVCTAQLLACILTCCSAGVSGNHAIICISRHCWRGHDKQQWVCAQR